MKKMKCCEWYAITNLDSVINICFCDIILYSLQIKAWSGGISMIWTFQFSKLNGKICINNKNWDNYNVKIGNSVNLLPKFDNNEKCWIGFNVI